MKFPLMSAETTPGSAGDNAGGLVGTALCLARRLMNWRPSEERINTWANHLIVIFCFSAPVLVDIRRPALFLILVLFLVRGSYIRHLSRPIRDPVVLSLTIYFTVHIAWLAGTDDWPMARKVIHDAAFLLIPLVFATFIDREYLPRMTGALWLGMAVGVLWALGIHLRVLPPNIHDGGHGTPGSPTPVWNPQPWAFMLSFTVVALLSLLRDLRGRPRLFVPTALLVPLTAYILLINPQRTGWIMGAVLLVAWAVLQLGRAGWKYILVLAAAISVGAVVAYHRSELFRFHTNATVHEIRALVDDDRFTGAVGWRAAIVRYGIEAGKDHWLLGLGTGDHLAPVKRLLAKDDSDIGRQADILQHLHGEYITAFLQFGIVGLALFLNIIVQLARYPGRDQGSRTTFRLLALAIGMYAFVDLFVIGFGSLLLAMAVVALGLRQHEAGIVPQPAPLGWHQAAGYVAAVAIFGVIGWIG